MADSIWSRVLATPRPQVGKGERGGVVWRFAVTGNDVDEREEICVLAILHTFSRCSLKLLLSI